MTLKQIEKDDRIEDQKEIELKVDDFDEAVYFLELIGAQKKAYQETKRELWKKDNIDITIDTWPGLNPLVEIESDNEDDVKKISKELGFDYKKALFCDVSYIYESELGITREIINNNYPELTFENPPKKYGQTNK